ADLLLPLGMTIGHGDFAIDRRAVAIILGYGLCQGGTILQRNLRRITDLDGAVAAEAQRATVEVAGQLTLEAARHALLDCLDCRRADIDIGFLCVRRTDEQAEQTEAAIAAARGRSFVFAA